MNLLIDQGKCSNRQGQVKVSSECVQMGGRYKIDGASPRIGEKCSQETKRGQLGFTTFHSSELPSLEMVRKVMWEHISDVFSPFLKYENKRNSGRGGILGPWKTEH